MSFIALIRLLGEGASPWPVDCKACTCSEEEELKYVV